MKARTGCVGVMHHLTSQVGCGLMYLLREFNTRAVCRSTFTIVYYQSKRLTGSLLLPKQDNTLVRRLALKGLRNVD